MIMARSARLLLSATTLAFLALVPVTAHATPAEADAVKLSTSGQRSLKWNWTPPGRSARYGHAEVLINAPMDKVRAQVQDFTHYQQLAPWRFTKSKIVGHEGSDTKVYMEFSVLNGMVKLSQVVKFAPARSVGNDTEIVEGKFVSGTRVKDANVYWTIERVDDSFTVLKCDIFMKPDLPIDPPQSAIDEELRDSAQQAVDGVHRKAQGHDRVVTWSPKQG
jgi:hypothetical protein